MYQETNGDVRIFITKIIQVGGGLSDKNNNSYVEPLILQSLRISNNIIQSNILYI